MLLAGANVSGATVLSLDDPTVATDQGVAFTAQFITAPFDAGRATGFATLRRLVQDVALTGTATVATTPYGDGGEYTSQALTSSLNVTAGVQQVIEAPVQVPATRFQQKVVVSAHTGTVEFGEADQWFVNRRTTRGG